MNMKKRNVLQVFIAIGLCASLTACSFQSRPDVEVKPLKNTTKTTYPKELKKFYTQKIEWSDCGDKSGDECTKINAPLDYNDPNGKTITLHAKRVKGKDPIGTLFINPGGPGGSGVEFAEVFGHSLASDAITNNYDIVGFDPRGVGKSTPVKCFTDKELDKYREEAEAVISHKSHEENIKEIQDYGQRCQKMSGDIYKNVDTISAAKDLDIWRHLVGDNYLNYFGYSYGTSLGAAYINLFPNNTGRLVLDGVVDTNVDLAYLQYTQAVGFEKALLGFAKDCIKSKECPLKGTTPEEVSKQVIDLIESLDNGEGLVSEDGRHVKSSIAYKGLIAALYNPKAYHLIRQALEQLITLKRPDGLLAFDDELSGRDEKGRYDNSSEAFNTIDSLDYSTDNLSDDEYKKIDDKIMKDAPIVGKFFTEQAELIKYWPVKKPRFRGVKTEPKHKILIVGTIGDPATPYPMAESVAKEIKNSYLLSWKNLSHGAYGGDSTCVQKTVDEYLLTGKVPAKQGLICK